MGEWEDPCPDCLREAEKEEKPMSQTTPCCSEEATHKTCPDGLHRWETRVLNPETAFEHTTDRCAVCHINRSAVDQYRGQP